MAACEEKFSFVELINRKLIINLQSNFLSLFKIKSSIMFGHENTLSIGMLLLPQHVQWINTIMINMYQYIISLQKLDFCVNNCDAAGNIYLLC